MGTSTGARRCCSILARYSVDAEGYRLASSGLDRSASSSRMSPRRSHPGVSTASCGRGARLPLPETPERAILRPTTTWNPGECRISGSNMTTRFALIR